MLGHLAFFNKYHIGLQLSLQPYPILVFMKKTIAFIKRYKAFIILFFIAIIVAQCSTTKSTTKKVDPFLPQQTDVTFAQAHWQGTTYAQLQQGYSIYSTKCNDCHDMKNIQDYSLTEWPGWMQKMGRKAKLDSTQYNLVYRYVMTRREALASVSK
jgi:hypothetical protein